MPKTIFYSWQSDLPNSANRGLIETALKKAICTLGDQVPSDSLELDQATRGSTGAPDIASTLLDKVRRASVLVADVSIIHSDIEGRRTPNPNVLLEVGWGAAHLGWDKVVLCVNKHFGEVEELPFDIRHRRCIQYSLDPATDEKATVRSAIERSLAAAVRDIVLGTPRKNAKALIRLVETGNNGLLQSLRECREASVLFTPPEWVDVQAMVAIPSMSNLVAFEDNGNMMSNSNRGMTHGFVMRVAVEFLELLDTA